MSPIITPGGGGSGGSQPVGTVVQVVMFSNFVVVGGGAWRGQAPYMTIQPTQVVLGCVIVVTEAFNDSGVPTEIQVVNAPDSPTEAALASFPDPKTTAVTDGIAYPDHLTSSIFPYQPNPAAITPVVGMLNGWNGDGTTGRALIFTTIYRP